jgi:hypothetical protein
LGQALLGFVALLAIFNAVVTIGVWRSHTNDLRQKLLQTLFVWVVPILGGALTWSLSRPIRSERVATDLADRGGSSVGVDDNIRLGNDAADVGGLGSGGDGGGH